MFLFEYFNANDYASHVTTKKFVVIDTFLEKPWNTIKNLGE